MQGYEVKIWIWIGKVVQLPTNGKSRDILKVELADSQNQYVA